mgnify:FL=1
MTYKITIGALTSELKDSIYKDFADHAISTMGFNGLSDEPIAFEINGNGINIGVCVCQLFWGNLHIKYLITRKGYKGQGIGRGLIEHALRYGKEQGCSFAFVETMNFQAPEFYQKLGFQIELKRDGYAGDSSFYYLRKDLL